MAAGEAEDAPEPRILQCIFCRAQLLFQGPAPPKRYLNHLRSQHDIIYQSEIIIEETFKQQFPELATNKKEDCDCMTAKKKKESEIHRPPTITTNPSDYNPAIARNIKKEVSHSEGNTEAPQSLNEILESAKANKINNEQPPKQVLLAKPGPKSRKSPNVPEEAAATINSSITPSPAQLPIPPNEPKKISNATPSAVGQAQEFEQWKVGSCEWKCSVCEEKFPHSLECWSHITTMHKLKIQDYNKCFGSPCIKESFHVCMLCSSQVRHDLGHLKKHIGKKHSFSLEQYYSMFVKNNTSKTDDAKEKMAKVNVKLEMVTSEVIGKNDSQSSMKIPNPHLPAGQRPATMGSDKKEINQSLDNLMTMINYMDNNLTDLPSQTNTALNSVLDKGVTGINKTMPSVADDLIKQMKQINEKSKEEDEDDVECSPDISAMIKPEIKADTSVVKSEETKIPWMWGTILECKICERQFLEQIDFKHHLDTNHQLDFDKYSEEHGDPTVVSNFHECLICGRGILHSPKSIRAHLHIHKMTTTAYYEKNKEEIDENAPELEVKDESLLKRMTTSNNNTGFKFNPINPHAPTGNFDSSLMGEGGLIVDLKWLDQCTYGCLICPTKPEFQHYNKMKHHLLDEHNKMTILIYSKEHGPIFFKNVWHACQICCAIVKWSPNQLGHHVTNIHKIKLVEYRSTYMPSYSDCPNVEAGNITDEAAKWMNRSIFDCEACPKTTDEEKINYDKIKNTLITRKKFTAHISSEHKLEIAQYFKNYKIEDPIMGKNITLHKCKICDKNVRWDQDSLMIHLTAMHSMQPQEYEDKYMKNYDTETKIKLGDSTRGPHHSSNQETSWSNKCLFECKICFNTFPSRGILITHFKKTHFITWQYHEMYFGESLFERKIIMCQLCTKPIQWDSYHLVSHMGEAHKVKILDYKKQYVEVFVDAKENESIPESERWMYQCEYGCKICRKKFSRKSNFFYHLTTDHAMEKQVYTDTHGEIEFSKRFHNCGICTKEVVWDGKNLKKHLGTHNVQPVVYNEKFVVNYQGRRQDEQIVALMDKCSFMCSHCSKVSNNKQAIINHVKEEHAIENNNDTGNKSGNGYSLAKLVLHSCMVCDENVIWDRKTLEYHVQTHNMTLIDYVKNKLEAYKENEECLKKHKENSEWMNGSLYECVACENRVFSRKCTLLFHIGEAHKDVEDKTSLRRTSKAASHICQICASTLEWDSASLKHHLRRRHNIMPDVYHSKYMDTYTTDTNFIQERRAATKKMNGEEEEEPEIKLKSKSSYIPKGPAELWSAKCKFECKICFETTHTRKAISTHFKDQHEISTLYHEEHFGPTLMDKSMLVCTLCSKDQIWDSYFLIGHLRKYHKMNLTAYKKKHVDGYMKADDEVIAEEDKWLYMSEYGCKICFVKYSNRGKFYTHLKNTHSMEIKDYKVKHGNIEFSKKFHVCQICKKETNWDKQNLSHHLGTHKITLESYYKQYMGKYNITMEADMMDMMNKSSFVCKLCNKLVNSKTKLVDHVKKDHSINDYAKDYESVHKESVAKRVLHTCVLCNKNILWDKDAIATHLKESHTDKSLMEYIKNDLPNYKENEECTKKHKEDSDWMCGCEYECIAQDCNMTFIKKDSWQWHTYNHKDITDKESVRRVLKATTHTCQICMHPDIEWDPAALKYHFETKHNIQPDVYYAKYMHSYSPDIAVIKERQAKTKDHRKRVKDLAQENQEEESEDDDTEEEVSGKRARPSYQPDYEDDAEWRSEDARQWAKGCLYFCEPCDSDFAGLKDFSFHLVSKHKTSFTRHCAKYQVKYVCIKKNFHFCKLCHKNVNHDEDDLAKHFRKEHDISGSDYYEQFKSKLKKPRLDRPEGFKPASSSADTTCDTSQDMIETPKEVIQLVTSEKTNHVEEMIMSSREDDDTKWKERNKAILPSHVPITKKLVKEKNIPNNLSSSLTEKFQRPVFNTMKPLLEPLNLSRVTQAEVSVNPKKQENLTEDEKEEEIVPKAKKLKMLELPLI